MLFKNAWRSGQHKVETWQTLALSDSHKRPIDHRNGKIILGTARFKKKGHDPSAMPVSKDSTLAKDSTLSKDCPFQKLIRSQVLTNYTFQPDTALTSRKSSSPQTPPSRPLPDCLYPPNGEPAPKLVPFICTIPARKRRATRAAFSLSWV